MSYGHDIYLDLDYDPAAFAAAVADVRTLFRRAEMRIARPSGRPATTPALEDDLIGFNGVNRNCTCDPGDPDYHRFMRCRHSTCRPWAVDSDVGQPFVIDLRPGHPYGISQSSGRYWIDCKTFRKPYDQAVMLAMIALKHHLGDRVELSSKGRWDVEWSHGGGVWSLLAGRRRPGPIDIYEHVFPDRALVCNILSKEEIG